jgi:digeranylgeranylglycerophospholipid reductase
VADGFIVVGDAARMVDPLSGGGLANGMLAAKIAGEVAAKAVKSGNVSAETLAEYDTSWRKRLEEKMYRNYLTKELLLKQSDETVDKVIETLGNTKMENVGTFEIIQAIAEKHPDVVKEIEKFFI